MRFPGAVYWLEVPYGFTRNPADPLPPAARDLDRPRFAPAMNALEPGARIVPWKAVRYDLGAIEDGRRLAFDLSNPFDAHCALALYQEGKPWDLHSPLTTVRIEDPDGYELKSRATSVSRDEMGSHRSDIFDFNRYPAHGRNWGTIVVTVGDASHRAVVPSSLFKYVHGVADAYHAALLREK